MGKNNGFQFLVLFVLHRTCTFLTEPALKIETQGSFQNQEWDNISHKKLQMDGALMALGSL
jgi:hypothetical protein